MKNYRFPTALFFTLLLLVFLAGCSSDGGPDGASVPTIELQPCSFDVGEVSEELRCGRLLVPVDRSGEAPGQIALNVVVVPAREQTGRVPLFMAEGGPGLAASDLAYGFVTALEQHRTYRDVVLVDQRGAGSSGRLGCEELESSSPLERHYPPVKVALCNARLETTTDTRFFTTTATAGDLEDVRAALGHDKIDLWGISYGSRVVQSYIKMFPDRVRSAALVGASSPANRPTLHHAKNAQRVLDLIFKDCEADPACSGAFPALREDWNAVLARLDEGPVELKLVLPGTTEPVDVRITRGPFLEALRILMTSAPGQRALPLLLHLAAEGDFASFSTAALMSGASGIAEGLFLSVTCAEDVGLIDEAEIASATADTFLGDYRVRELMGACKDWKVSAPPAGFTAPVTSDVPVLLISGARDHDTPAAWGAEVAEHLSNGRHVVIEQMPQVPFGLSNFDCFAKLMLDFFDRASATALDTTCTSQMQPPPFALE